MANSTIIRLVPPDVAIGESDAYRVGQRAAVDAYESLVAADQPLNIGQVVTAAGVFTCNGMCTPVRCSNSSELIRTEHCLNSDRETDAFVRGVAGQLGLKYNVDTGMVTL